MKKALALILTLIMVLGLMPAALAETAPVEGEVTITKSLVSATPDEDGNYTIKLTVQGNPVTQSAQSNADVVLVVDNSGSMTSSVGEPCETSEDNFENVAYGLLKKCPTCGALYSPLFYVPDSCEGQKGTTVRINAAMEVGKTFAENILSGTGNKMAVVGFAGSSGGANESGAIKVSTGLTDNLNTIKNEIDKMSADGGTNYTAALKKAYDILNGRSDDDKASRPGYVVFISDGAPGARGESQGKPDWDGSVQISALKNADITIYTIGIALDDDSKAYEYLKNMASEDQNDHFRNVSGTNYQEQLKSILKDWADDINTVPAGTNAVMTDVINSEYFEYVSSDEGLTYNKEKHSLTWNIGDIPAEVKEVTFQVKPKDGWTGKENTNVSCTLTYTKPDKTAGSATAPSPQVTIAATTGKIVVTKNVVMPEGDNTSVNGKEYSFTITQKNGTHSETKKVTIGDNNTGSVTFENVPFGNYTVTESDAGMQGYAVTTTSDHENDEVTVSDTANGNITFTNTYAPETIDIPVKKVWDDEGYVDPRPRSVTVKLLADGQEVAGKTLTLDATATTDDAQWTGMFMDLPKYKDGNEITYNVIEDPVPEGYQSAVTGSVANGFTITNTKLAEGKTVVTVQKTWEAPEGTIYPEVSVNVLNGDLIVDTITLNEENGWRGSSGELDIYPSGATVGADPIKYTVREVDIPNGYIAKYNETAGGWQITNTIEKQYTVKLEKIVEGYEGSLSDVEVTVENEEGTYKKTHKVPVNSSIDIQVPAGTYTVTENTEGIQVPGYTLNTTYAPNEFTVPAEIAETAETADTEGIAATVTVTNTYTKMEDDTGSLIVKKTVSGGGASYNKEFTFTVTLTENNDPQNDAVTYGDVTFTNGVATFTLKHNQEKSITGIPAEYTYTVTEDADGYTQSITSGSATGTIEKGKTATVTFNNYKSGGGHYYPTPNPVPPIFIPPKTGDMTIWQSILHFLGIR